jgi:RimJ/RimL family protein N-acetyltransferase
MVKSETSETQEEFIKAIKDGFLHVVICLAPASPNAAPIPIGTMGLNRDLNPRRLHHRNASIGLRILKEYRGKGYGGEAIKWATDYCFRRAGLHKVKITYYGHNDKAGRLYVRMGFVEEGRLRDELWHDGRWWEMVQCSMLEEEYWEKVKAGTW